jgi:predicted AlkP superfamily pyrophosphatase or phosphodiesterase
MFHGLRRLALAACAFALLLLACRTATLPPERAIVILVSIDGFRWDYLEKFSPPTLVTLAAEGVRSEGLIPQFPSKTFPNHYTIVTGLRLANHGIISNNMVAPDIPGRFSLANRDVLADSRWWGGEPIWNTAERQARVASAMFWPGSEAVIGGRQATYWMPYDPDMPNDARVAKTLDWLAQPERTRPSFLTLYFSDVDSAGHSRGPDSQDVREAVARVDRSLARLVNGVRAAGLNDRVHYVVVSDHGMAQLATDRMIVLDDLVSVDTVDVVDWSPVLALSPKNGNVEALYTALKGKHPALSVYKSVDLPAKYGLAGHPRLPPVVGIADEGWYVTSARETERWRTGDRHAPGGTHGYDPQLRSMHGLFVAAGPRLQRGMRVPPFENIHVYELMCALLGLQPATNDGDPTMTRPILR